MIMEGEKFRHLQEYVICRFWKKMDAAHTVVRFVTRWATTMEDVRQLELVLENRNVLSPREEQSRDLLLQIAALFLLACRGFLIFRSSR